MKSLREYIDRLDEIASQPSLKNSVFNHDNDNGYVLYEDDPDASRRKFLGKAAATAAGAGLAAAGVKPAQASYPGGYPSYLTTASDLLRAGQALGIKHGPAAEPGPASAKPSQARDLPPPPNFPPPIGGNGSSDVYVLKTVKDGPGVFRVVYASRHRKTNIIEVQSGTIYCNEAGGKGVFEPYMYKGYDSKGKLTQEIKLTDKERIEMTQEGPWQPDSLRGILIRHVCR